MTTWRPTVPFDLWHDRAVFHFLTEAAERRGYIEALRVGLRSGGSAVIATFALDGPERCSGLPIRRYSPEMLASELGPGFARQETRSENHLTRQEQSSGSSTAAFLGRGRSKRPRSVRQQREPPELAIHDEVIADRAIPM